MHDIARKYGYGVDDKAPKPSMMFHKDGHSISLNPHGGNLGDTWIHTDSKGVKKGGKGEASLKSHLANLHGTAIQHSEESMLDQQFKEPVHLGSGFSLHGHDKEGNVIASQNGRKPYTVPAAHFTHDRKGPLTDKVKRSVLQSLFKWARKTTDPKRDKKDADRSPEEKQFNEQPITHHGLRWGSTKDTDGYRAFSYPHNDPHNITHESSGHKTETEALESLRKKINKDKPVSNELGHNIQVGGHYNKNYKNLSQHNELQFTEFAPVTSQYTEEQIKAAVTSPVSGGVCIETTPIIQPMQFREEQTQQPMFPAEAIPNSQFTIPTINRSK